MGTACNGVRVRPKNLGGRQRKRNPVVQGAKDWAPAAYAGLVVREGSGWRGLAEDGGGVPEERPGKLP